MELESSAIFDNSRVRPFRVSSVGRTPKRIVVAGGAGFLGSHLCERLLSEGEAVVCLDDFSTGDARNVAHLASHPDFKILQHNVINPIDLEVDEIYNLACPASPPDYQADPVRTLKTSVFGALNLLDLARRRDIRILQASTSEIYGDPHVHPQPEGYWGNVNPIGPRGVYDEAKRFMESITMAYHNFHEVDTRIIRIFNTYGPRMRPNDGRVVSNFIVQCLQGNDITIYGDGSQTRSFCYVDDLIEGFVRLMRSPADVTGPINLGNPGEFTIRELATLVVSMTRSRSKITYLPLPTDDPRQRRPDISEAKRQLRWAPNVDLVEGLARTIAYFDSILCADAHFHQELVA